MFITLTIDTNQKKKNLIRMHSKRFNAASGWRKTIHAKKRNMWQRVAAWKRSLKTRSYRLDGQIAMF